MSARSLEEQITLEAAEWLIRLDESPELECRGEFLAWLKRSPRHMDEFLMVEAAYRAVHQFDPQRRIDVDALVKNASAEVVRWPERATPAGRPRIGRRAWLRRPLASVAAVLCLIVGFLALAPHLWQTRTYATDIGEQRAFKLEDGSLLHLNTGSRAEVHFSEQAREVRLLQGEALFTVKHDPSRPFRVSTGSAVVQAVGTAFNVYRRADDSTLVSVIEGRVKVASHTEKDEPARAARSGSGQQGESSTVPVRVAATTPLAAGEEADILGGQIVKRPAPDVAQTLAWRQRRLVFRETTLREAVTQFNRYNTDVQLQVQGDAVAQRRITGTFDADEPQALLKFLEQDASVELQREAATTVIRPRTN